MKGGTSCPVFMLSGQLAHIPFTRSSSTGLPWVVVKVWGLVL